MEFIGREKPREHVCQIDRQTPTRRDDVYMNSSRLFDVNPLPPIGTGRPVGPIGNPQSVFYTPTMAGAPTQATLPGSAPPILNNPRMPHGYHGQSEVNSE